MPNTRLARVRRHPWLLVAGIGVALTALLGSGVFAVVTDSVYSDTNAAQSGEFDGIHNLEVALTDVNNSSCSGVTWLNQNNVAAILVGNADLAEVGVALTTEKRVCVRTHRIGTYALRMRVAALVDEEVACSNTRRTERTFDNDSCGSGMGELSRVMNVVTFRNPIDTADATCPGGANVKAIRTLVTTPLDLCTIRKNNTVVSFFTAFQVNPSAAENDLVAAQSDRVQFSFQFTLEQ